MKTPAKILIVEDDVDLNNAYNMILSSVRRRIGA
jgi:DNA-binding NtrC family response regulator